MPHRLQHTAHLAFAALAQAHVHIRALPRQSGAAALAAMALAPTARGRIRPDEPLGPPRLVADERTGPSRQRGPVVQHEALAQTTQIVVVQTALHKRQIGLVHMAARMQKPMAQLAVGGEQEQPRGVGVEPSHRKERRVRGQRVGHECGHRGPTLGIAHSGHVAGGLVQHEGGTLLGKRHRHTIHGHRIGGGIHRGAHLGYHRTVDRHMPRGDQSLGMTARGHPGPCQKLLQAHLSHSDASPILVFRSYSKSAGVFAFCGKHPALVSETALFAQQTPRDRHRRDLLAPRSPKESSEEDHFPR